MPAHKIIKESGEAEKFNKGKIRRSLLNSGMKAADAEQLIDMVLRTIEPPYTTRKVFRAAKKHMRRMDLVCTMKYSLKQAIYALGPSGYPFEKYIGKVLAKDGYTVEVGKFVEGACVTHEVDVVALRDDSCYVVECKFHHSRRTISDVKTALYVHARFEDIREAGDACPNGNHLLKGMIVTNTRFSSEAVKYAECVGLETLGWKYPVKRSLEKVIEQRRTYPVTVLPAATKAIVRSLIESDIVLASEIDAMDARRLSRVTGLKPAVVDKLKMQSGQLCG
jgi:hypothetical protein